VSQKGGYARTEFPHPHIAGAGLTPFALSLNRVPELTEHQTDAICVALERAFQAGREVHAREMRQL